jgi:GNAT superfamily N-acetyltransferase
VTIRVLYIRLSRPYNTVNQATVRPAIDRDLDVLCRLYVEFHEFHVRGFPDRLQSLGRPEDFDCSELNRQLRTIMAGPDSMLFVAFTGDALVGLAEVYIREDQRGPAVVTRRHGLLQSMMIHESCRHQHIGTTLIEAAEEWARTQGAVEMRLEAWEFPQGPLQFYEKLGYSTLKRKLVKAL